jgi:hypothetical protein
VFGPQAGRNPIVVVGRVRSRFPLLGAGGLGNPARGRLCLSEGALVLGLG